jgi:hypothetical protein
VARTLLPGSALIRAILSRIEVVADRLHMPRECIGERVADVSEADDADGCILECSLNHTDGLPRFLVSVEYSLVLHLKAVILHGYEAK